MWLIDWFRSYWNPTPPPDLTPLTRCPSCRSHRAAFAIPPSPEVETHVCLSCSYEWSIPRGIASRGLPQWQEPATHGRAELRTSLKQERA